MMKISKELKEKMKQQLNNDEYLTSITRKSFDAADKNGNGVIDIKELKACMIDIAQGMGSTVPEDESARNEFFHLDKDKNNTVDFNEFKQFVKKNMIMLIDRMPEE